MPAENAIIIVNKTRLESLIQRFNTRAQAKFYIEHNGGDFNDYEIEHQIFKESLASVIQTLSETFKCKVIERSFLPNYLFTEKDIPFVLGQDGLVANTAKYVNGLPIVAINPDTDRYDGVLLPFTVKSFREIVKSVQNYDYEYYPVTMAKATLNNGQTLLAFNDFFIGPSSHISARYNLRYASQNENQSSSGIIVSTGAGATGWLSSIQNMVKGISNEEPEVDLRWNSDKLFFVVREPFVSKYSSADVVSGYITEDEPLEIESFMPQKGVIFSDGIENDFLSFNSGSIVKIGLADKKARIVALP